MNRKTPRLILVALVAMSVMTSKASAESLQGAVDTICRNVQTYLKAEGKNSILVKAFTAAGASVGVAPRAVESEVRAKLVEMGIEVQDTLDQIEGKVEWTLEGRVSVSRNTGSAKPTVAKVTVDITDAVGTKVTAFNAFGETSEGTIDDPADIPKILTTVADIQQPFEQATGKAVNEPAPEDPQERRKIIRESATVVKQVLNSASQQPGPGFESSPTHQIRATKNSRFSLQILASNDPNAKGTPIAIRNTQLGIPFADLQEGQFITIVVRNENSFDVGVELLLDGINSLQFAENEATRRSGKWLLEANSQGEIRGWFVNSTSIDRFAMTSEPTGVAAKLGERQQIGTIQANFFLAFPVSKGEPKPVFIAATNPNARGNAAFGQGPRAGFQGQVVKRAFDNGVPLASIGVIHRNPEPKDAPLTP